METVRQNWAPHPGEIIKEEIEARGWSQRDLAYILGTPEQAVNMILSGKRGISSEMAKAFANAFDVPAEFFSNLQKAYELSQAPEPDPGVAKRARIQSQYPVREMIKRGWLQDSDAPMLEAQLARFFEVTNISDVPHLAHSAKKSSYEDVLPEQLAWLFRAKQIAKELQVPKYSEKSLADAIPSLRQLLVDPEEIRHVPRILMECGVRLVFVEPLPSSKIDGVCFWLDKASPVIGMSLRLDRIDNFWFVLRHEIEHVLQKHGQQSEIIDADIGSNKDASLPEEEKIANNAGSDFCVPKREMDSFFARKNPFFYERDVLGFAKIMQVHPGLVVGQLHARTEKYEYLRKYLVKVRNHVLPGAIVDGWGHTFPISL